MTKTKNYIPIEDRTLDFALRVIKLCQVLDEKPGANRTLSNQLLRSATSIGANVEESRAAQSTRDFIHKLEIALKEGRETRYWIRLIVKAELVTQSRLNSLLKELEEINKIIASIIVKTKKNL